MLNDSNWTQLLKQIGKHLLPIFLSKCVHLATLGIKGLTKSVPKIYTFSQFVQSQYSMHFSNVLLHPQFFVHPFLQGHFVVRYDGMVAKFLVGTNNPFSMTHP